MSTDLFRFPLAWHDRRLQELHLILASSLYREADIVQVVTAAGLSPADVPWADTPRGIWLATLNEAAGHGEMPRLLEQAAARQPQLGTRFAELLGAQPKVSASKPATQPRWMNFSDAGRERQIVQGQDTLLDVAFLQRGVDCARAVCRLTVRMGHQTFLGTGFRIGDRTILTNHHVLYDWDRGGEPATDVTAQFGYELDLDGKLKEAVEVRCAPATIRGERAHDFAVVEAIGELPAEVTTLRLGTSSVNVDDRVYIVQHPQGLPKKVALAHNLVRYVDGDVIQYWTDTEAGSSGSPVFDDSWNLVALHHQWVLGPPDDQGIAYRNQGRAIGRIAERMAKLGAAPGC